jgi:hypothetical protein
MCAACLLVLLVGCEKDNDPPSLTKKQMLTSHMLIYEELDQLPNRNVLYKRGAAGNVLNFDRQRVHFYQDGTYDEFNINGEFITGNWEFLNNETEVRVYGSGYSNVATIVSLTEDRFEWRDDGQNTYGIQVSKK